MIGYSNRTLTGAVAEILVLNSSWRCARDPQAAHCAEGLSCRGLLRCLLAGMASVIIVTADRGCRAKSFCWLR